MDVLYDINSSLAMVTKVPLTKFSNCTPNQVSKLVPHDMQQKPLWSVDCSQNKCIGFYYSSFFIVCFHIPFNYASYFPLHITV